MLRVPSHHGDAERGHLEWDRPKSLWNLSMAAIALAFGVQTFSVPALAVCMTLTGLTLLAGHSVGMHRLLIHRSFQCPRLVERILVYGGVLVGLGGPLGLIEMHDLRDWAQRQAKCHDFFAHRRPIVRDGLEQRHCKIILDDPPAIEVEASVRNDPFYIWLERTWRWQQLPLGLALFLWGGAPFVVWGIAVRITLSTLGHWFVGYFAHRSGHRNYHIEGAAVQGYDLWLFGAISFGEGWHNNHHAFPGSARMGLHKGQLDMGYAFIQLLRRLGLAHDVREPKHLPPRAELRVLGRRAGLAMLASRHESHAIGHCPPPARAPAPARHGLRR